MDVPTSGSPPAGGGTYFLGRYRVVDEIGIGGMASVHLARMDGPGGFQKWVAIKRIHAHLIEDDSFVHMFLDEARVAARISHPNVANVFDLGKDNDSYWIAMEYLHGEPLREVMRRTEEMGQPMPPEIACRVIADAAEGLHAAHELLGKNGEKLQLVHRDVTPHNLFVTYDGTTKVVDFGIAKFSSRTSNTRAGTLKGKLAYMSPEQVHGEGIDRRTDIFALGVVLWELTTGQRLFRMESDLDTLAKVQECNVPRPSSIIRGYPIDLEKIVMKALAKNRGERFRTARELSRALQSLLMRRGLFIASDEVAAYVQVIFQDRIQKREAHLRWAADVTQTINLDGMLAKQAAAPEPSLQSYSSEAPDPRGNAVPAAPRPAAGQPALRGAPGGPPSLQGQQPPFAGVPTATGKQQVPQGPPPSHGQPNGQAAGIAKPTVQQLASTVGAPAAGGVPRPGRTSAVPPRPATLVQGSGPGARETFRPPGMSPSAPPVSARASSQPPSPPRHTRVQIDPHDSTDDGPTIQAPAHLAAAASYPGAAPPIGATLGPGGVPVPSSSARALGGPQLAPGYEEEPEDATLVTAARMDEVQVVPAAGRPAPQRAGSMPQVYQPPSPVPQRQASGNGLALPPVVVASPGRPGDPRLDGQASAPPSGQDVNAGPPTLAGPPYAPWMPPGMPGPVGPNGVPLANGSMGSLPGVPSPNDPFGLGVPAGPPGAPVPTMAMPGMEGFRYAPPGNPLETTRLQVAKKKPSLVLVAVATTLAALCLTFISYLFVSRAGAPSTPNLTGDPSVANGVGAGGTGSPNASGGGPFSVVRAGFREASVGGPSSGATPSPPSSMGLTGSTGDPSADTDAGAVAMADPAPAPTPDPPSGAAATPPPAPSPAAAPSPPPAPVAGNSNSGGSSRTRPAPPATSAKSGYLTVICTPACDQIVDNGRALGTAPIFRREVPSGEHHVKLMNGAVAKNVSVIIVADDLKIIKMSMTP